VVELDWQGKYFSNNARISLFMVSVSFFSSQMASEKLVCWGVWVVGVGREEGCVDVFVFLISMAFDGYWLGFTLMDAMAFRSCSTAMTIVVFSWAISCFSESSSIVDALGSCNVDCIPEVCLIQLLLVFKLDALVVDRGGQGWVFHWIGIGINNSCLSFLGRVRVVVCWQGCIWSKRELLF